MLVLFRIATPLAGSVVAYILWRWVRNQNQPLRVTDRLLIGIYLASRIRIWLVFALWFQRYVGTSDPRIFYMPEM